jgi:hypothetical protein
MLEQTDYPPPKLWARTVLTTYTIKLAALVSNKEKKNNSRFL